MTLTRQAVRTRYEAVVILQDGVTHRGEWPRETLEACATGLTVGVVAGSPLDLPNGNPEAADLGVGALLVASASSPHRLVIDGGGARAVDGDGAGGLTASEPLDWIYRELWARGIAPSETLVVAGEDAVEALTVQCELRRAGTLPEVAPAPGWEMGRSGFDIDRLRLNAVLFSLADGVVGSSGGSVADHPQSPRWVLVGDTYVGRGPDSHLLGAPVAARLPFDMADPPRLSRTLDLRAGVLREDVSTTAGALITVRFCSLARPGTLALRADCPTPSPDAPPLTEPADDPVAGHGETDGAQWMSVAGEPGGVTAAARDVVRGRLVDRVAVYRADPDRVPDPAEALGALEAACSTGFDGLLAEHRAAWARRWADADIALEGDPELQQALRFSLFHLMSSAPDEGEAAVGARGLTGPGYRGHVFWDADTFTLPFLAATHPPAARAMLEYRLRRLPAALAAAAQLGREGARFPWESAQSGRDVTPVSARDRAGRLVPIRTGSLEEHIVAEVAWAACCYADWTGDEDFVRGPGLELLVQTARYWASRVRLDSGGAAHIYGVIGPDEYHEPVDDNAFTNVMARWNLRRAAAAVRAAGSGAEPGEVDRWLGLAGALIDGYDPDTGVYEQFAGYHRLEPLIISEVAPRRPIAADLLLGAERVNGSQVIKQADVLMLHHLVPDEVEPDSLDPNLRYYEPRTAHGSSLSPAIHASLFARTRNYGAALDALRIASRIDLDDLTGSTAAGLHIATMGGLWQALAFGFAGLRPDGGRLAVDPRLPHEWASLELNVRFRGSRVTVQIGHYEMSVRAEAPTPVLVQGDDHRVGPGSLAFTRTGKRWEVS